MSKHNERPFILVTCATCGKEGPDYSFGSYGDLERAFCLQRDGIGCLCFKNRNKIDRHELTVNPNYDVKFAGIGSELPECLRPKNA